MIFTEGAKTEPQYMTHWYRLYRGRVIVTIDEFHGTPLPLVRAAVDRKKSDKREARRGRGDAFDEYWCMFDEDERPALPEALELATAHDIGVALSHPCVELWFLLHFGDQWAALERDEAQRRWRQKSGCDKAVPEAVFQELADHYSEARTRAQALDKKHVGDGSPAHSNPSSDAWRLVDRIRPASGPGS